MAFPLLIPIAEALAVGAAYNVVNNYITKPTSAGSSTLIIPTSRRISKTSAKITQKKALGDYALGVGGILAATTATLTSSLSSGKSEAEAFSAEQSSKTSELASASSASPLLTNQVFMKDSIDKLIDAINTNSLVTASVFGTFDANLSAIGSSLTSISATLIEVSDNYSRELNNTDDLPYINQDDYYDMLAESGMGFFEINDLKNQENMFYDALIKQGYGYDDIKAQIQNWRKNTVPISGQAAVEKELSGISTTPRVDSNGNSVSSPSALELPNVEKWAESQFVINEYLTTQSQISDLDGNVVASVSPLQAQSIKNVTDARLRTDMNNYSETEQDIDDSFMSGLDLSSLFTFSKKSVRLNNLMGEFGSGG